MPNYKIKLMNLSSGDVIYASSTTLKNYGHTKTMNWETSLVVGRMDPIQNFRNTEAKINIGIVTSNVYYRQLSKMNGKRHTSQDLEEIFQLETSNREGIGIVDLDIYSTEGFRGFFYPSYLQDGNVYSVLTAPVFRCKISSDSKVMFSGYCTIPDFNFEKQKFVNDQGNSFQSILSFTLNVIHTNLKSVSSRTFTTQEIQDLITGL